ncbi:hypothetical protein HDV57DRAFT_500111 [Trichoderma longibrachiatum]
MSGGFQRALPLALTVFCGVIGGFYTFQPLFAPPPENAPADKVRGKETFSCSHHAEACVANLMRP